MSRFEPDRETERAQRRSHLYQLLGDLPERNLPISAVLLEQTEQDGYLLEKLLLEVNGIETVPAYFVKPYPSGANNQQYPCILYNHAHGGDYELGKRELLIGRSALQPIPYAQALTANGFAALCIDAWCFGERRGRTESSVFKEMLWQGKVLWGMMAYDSLRAVDYLVSRSDVDSARLGTLGLSMGSTMAWWVAALDTRLKVCVDICCLTDFQALIATYGLDGHGVYYYVPALLKYFTTAQINALIVPRAHLSLAGNYDPLTPSFGLGRIDQELKQLYAAEGYADSWQLYRSETGHFETANMRFKILDFLKKRL